MTTVLSEASELVEVIGKEGVIALAEKFGGTRLYVPKTVEIDSEIVQAIGLDAAGALSARYAPDVIRIPLAREYRAVHYRCQGYSNAKIAVKLGLTESGVNRIFKRLVARGTPIGPFH